MRHLNSNILCAVTIKTTGSDAQKHELLEIIVLPLASDLTIKKDILPFNVLIKPEKIRRAEYNLDNNFVLNCIEKGLDKYEAADIFEAWFEKLELRYSKKIMVLTHNWAAKRDFIKEWLQPTGFDKAFHHEYRDVQAIGLFYNDKFDFKNEMWPFPKVKLSYMCAVQKLEYEDRLPTVVDEAKA
ncbi:MAG: hypothetical protein R3321_06845, partial [Nitrososphaeraceae archaeon]|nr:hypothetical protein [Nitrososphaeraceae archaeon]